MNETSEKLKNLVTEIEEGMQTRFGSKEVSSKLKNLKTIVEQGKQTSLYGEPIAISQDMKNDILSAQTPQELQDAMDRVKQQLADQMPVELTEKMDEWRYLAMLGSPRTHIRNTLSNVAMRGTYETKNLIQRVIETVASPVLEERTRTFEKASEDVKRFAKQSAIDNKNAISGGGKLSLENELKEMRHVFKTGWLEGARKLNSNALNVEDLFFSQSAYRNNLAEYLTANGIKTQKDIDLNPELVEKGIQHAIEESQKTTFRQYSKLANLLNQAENSNAFGKIIIGGVLPFKKTPINIAKTGASYSPLGLAETLTWETKKLVNGEIDATQYIDRLSQGLTGTVLMGLGALFSSLGILKGSTDKEEEYAENIGQTNSYSLRIGNINFDLTWLSPTAMPFLMGAELYQQIENDEDVDLNDLWGAFLKTIDPLSEMSMLSSVNDAIRSYSTYEDNLGAISSVLEKGITAYTGQYIPSLFSSINKIIDPTVRTTKASKNSKFKALESVGRQTIGKLPGGSFLLEPATDLWGNEKKRSDNILIRSLDALVNPASVTADKTTDVDKSILALYEVNKNNAIIPQIPKNQFTENKYKYEMSAKEHTSYKKEYGQTAYKELEKLFKSQEYENMNTDEKEDAIKDVYKFAEQKAKQQYGINAKELTHKYGEDEASKRLLGEKQSEKQIESGIPLLDYYNAWIATQGIESDKNWKGETITNSKSKKQKEAIDKATPDLDKWERRKLYEIFNVGKSVW